MHTIAIPLNRFIKIAGADNNSRFQFSLSRMLLAVTYFSMALATLGRILEILRHITSSSSALDAVAVMVFPFAFAGLLGAAVGTLFNQSRHGAKLAVRYLLVFISMIIVDAILIVAAFSIWYWVSTW
jgi:predicted neutral ceramidase superfamily lipid hydrolase